jgi:hypothetical protein
MVQNFLRIYVIQLVKNYHFFSWNPMDYYSEILDFMVVTK